MQYPLLSEYVRAIEQAGDNLDRLRNLVPVPDDHGEPFRSSGAFAVVFKMRDPAGGKLFALKCFTEEQERRSEAYHKISRELEWTRGSYFTPMQYYDRELFVDAASAGGGGEYPVLCMEWVEGVTMESYIRDYYRDSYRMALLCHNFCKMAAWLRSQPFAHGDVKPDNIIVGEDGNLTLVDYDGMFVPEMKGEPSPTLGTQDFRHPLRTPELFDETIDDFALSVIALSLKAIALEPGLLDNYGAPDRLLELPGLPGEDGCPGPLRGVAPGLSGVTIPWALRLSSLHLLPGVEQLVGISLVVKGLAEVVDRRLPYDLLSISLEVLPDVVRLLPEAVSEV